MSQADAAFDDDSLVRDEALSRWQHRIGLVPRDGLGLVRRAVFWTLVAWAPMAVWALLNGRAIGTALDEPLLTHFGVHMRFLVAVPLLILAEGPVHAATTGLLRQLERSGLVPESALPRLRQVARDTVRLRRAAAPWLMILAVALAIATIDAVTHRAHELVWAEDSDAAPGGIGFGGWWLLYVARPIFLAIALGWLWRAALLTILFARLARLGLAIVPTHPDGAGGLAFIERVPRAFALVVFATSAVLAAGWAHDVVYHGLEPLSLRVPMAAFVVLSVLVFCGPLLAFAGCLGRAKRQALLDYGALFARHGRLVHQRWIEGKALADDALLNAPELGPIADTQAAYDAVRRMRVFLFQKGSILTLALAAIVPFIVVIALKMPVREILIKLVKVLL